MTFLSRMPAWVGHHVAAIRVVIVLTLLVGLAYPLGMTAIAQIPGLHQRAQGSALTGADGRQAGSTLIGQSFVDKKGNPIPYYFQPRPSNAGTGYDASASAAGNLGPESTVDVLPLKGQPDSGKQSLLTQVCARSKAVGELEHVDGSRPYCTADGVGAVLGVFRDGGTTGRATRVVSVNQACPAKPFVAAYEGVTVVCAEPGRTTARPWSPRSAVTCPPTPRSRPTRSPRAPADSTPRSAPPTPSSRRRASPASAG
ncbi:potassium-transporting ATPase subunit C [Streptomyces chiangmaiensis]